MPKREAVARPGEGGKSTFAAGRLLQGTLSDLDALPVPARGCDACVARACPPLSPLGPGFGAD
jgi:hypothetical protein